LSLTPLSDIVTTLRAAGCVFAEDEAHLLVSAAGGPEDLAAMVDRRVAGVPLEHVLGWAEFCGLRIAVDPGVFVPRRRTELLAWQAADLAHQTADQTRQAADLAHQTADQTRQAADLAHQTADQTRQAADLARQAIGELARQAAEAVVVDLCCGSGAVGAVVAATVNRLELYAVDIEPAAVACARRNLIHGRVYEGDLYEPLPAELRGRVDVLVANAPYVPTEAVGLMPPEARLHEPRVALDGGADGLDVLRRVTEAAPHWLAPGGHLLFETSERQAAPAIDFVARSGLLPRVLADDELGATVVIGASRQV